MPPGKKSSASTGRLARPEVSEDEVLLGYISAPFGVRGEVKLFLYNPGSELFDEPLDLFLVNAEGERFLVEVEVRPGAGKRVIARIDGCEDREHAEELVGLHVVVPKAVLPELDDDTFYHHQLLGLLVETASGTALGRIRQIHTAGSVDMWIVSGKGGEVWVPFRDGAVLEVRPGDRAVVADDAVMRLSEGL